MVEQTQNLVVQESNTILKFIHLTSVAHKHK